MNSDCILISVIVPAHDRPQRLRECLEALCRQDLPLELFEVIVVDDGSVEPLADQVGSFTPGFNLLILRQANGGPASARNRGAHAARGALLTFTDDDCQPRPGWLRAFQLAATAMPEALLGGVTQNALPDNIFSQTSQELVDYLYAYFDRTYGTPKLFTSNNIALSRERFLAIGGFDTSFPLAAGEDRELCDRWIHFGGLLHYVPEAVVDHKHELSLRKFWRQHSNYGRGAYHFARALKGTGRPLHRREPLPFYLGLIRHPLRNGTRDMRVGRMFLQVLSQVAVLYGFASARRDSQVSGRGASKLRQRRMRRPFDRGLRTNGKTSGRGGEHEPKPSSTASPFCTNLNRSSNSPSP